MFTNHSCLKHCTVVIVNYNSAEYVANLLDSIFTYYELNIYIVDNKSTDESIALLQEYISEQRLDDNIFLLKTSCNLGFASGCNVGIAKSLESSMCKLVWVLNPDTIVTRNSLEEMIHVSSQEVGIVGSKLVYMHDKKTIQSLGGELNSFFATGRDIINPEKLYKLDYIVGASMLISRVCIEKIGFLPEEYFLYAEEADYCLKAKKYGFKLKVAIKSVVYHAVGGTTGASNDSRQRSEFIDLIQINNRKILARKYFKITIGVYVGIIIAALNRCRRGQWERGYKVLKLILKDYKWKNFI